jgi:cytidylate kinase
MKKKISVAIDSPAAAGAGTQAKLIAKYYNLFYLDTGKIYRFVGYLKIKYKKKFNYTLVKKKINNLKIKELQKKKLLSNKVATVASIIAKDKKIRKIVHNFQKKCAYKPPKNFSGSILDGRDITSVIMKDASIKFFITANVRVRALRRFKELKSLNKKITYQEVLKSIKKRDKSDYQRAYSPLKKTKDSILINTSNLTKRSCFLKIKQIIDKKIKLNGNL